MRWGLTPILDATQMTAKWGVNPTQPGWAPHPRPLRPIIPLYHAPRNLSRENVKKVARNNYPEFM